MFGFIRTEARDAKIEWVRWAQYTNAAKVSLLLPRKRSWQSFYATANASTVILDGWGHPEPESGFGAPVDGVATSKYWSFDPRIISDFSEWLAQYIKTSGATKLADLRGMDPRAKTGEQAMGGSLSAINDGEAVGAILGDSAEAGVVKLFAALKRAGTGP
jgi:hypothetical protein